MMKLKYLAAALALPVFAAPATAAPFEGLRLEGRVGWDNISVESRYDDGEELVNGESGGGGIAFGAEAGFDIRFGSLIVGSYAGVEGSSHELCEDVFGDDEACIASRRNIEIGLRGGLAISERALAYVKGGYSNGSVTASYEGFEDVIDSFEISDDRGGYHVGAGLELGLTERLYAKAEFVHTRYDAFVVDEDNNSEISRNRVIGGVGIRF